MAVNMLGYPTRSSGSTRHFFADYRGATPKLEPGELLSAPVTVAELDTSDLTIANEAINTDVLEIGGRQVQPGEAVQWTVSGGQPGYTYRLLVTVQTDQGQVFEDISRHCVK